MIEPVYVPYEEYRAAKTRCGLDSRIYGTNIINININNSVFRGMTVQLDGSSILLQNTRLHRSPPED
jgi:hypothetical protein